MKKLLANENFPGKSVRYLKERGFDVLYIRNSFPGISDEEVLEIAVRENRTILTFDSDYGTLIFKYKHRPQSGVIYFRMDAPPPELPGKIVEQLIVKAELNLDFRMVVIDETSIRQKPY